MCEFQLLIDYSLGDVDRAVGFISDINYLAPDYRYRSEITNYLDEKAVIAELALTR